MLEENWLLKADKLGIKSCITYEPDCNQAELGINILSHVHRQVKNCNHYDGQTHGRTDREENFNLFTPKSVACFKALRLKLE